MPISTALRFSQGWMDEQVWLGEDSVRTQTRGRCSLGARPVSQPEVRHHMFHPPCSSRIYGAATESGGHPKA